MRRTCTTALRRALSNIHPVDRGLILFMLVLLVQSAYSIFFPNDANAVANDIDIIVRTSAAAIFGYFLSANFILHNTPSVQAHPPEAGHMIETVGQAADSSAPKSQIGFYPSDTPAEVGAIQEMEDSHVPTASCLQVVVATGIGLFCLVTLLLLRNTAPWNEALSSSSDSVTATVAQLRDFVSGCVGFLIGTPTNSSTQTQS